MASKAFGGDLNTQLVHAVTEYDRREQRKAARHGYRFNHYALAHYLGACADVAAEVKAGAPVRQALVSHFCGRLLDVVLRAAGEPKSTDAEQRIGL